MIDACPITCRITVYGEEGRATYKRDGPVDLCFDFIHDQEMSMRFDERWPVIHTELGYRRKDHARGSILPISGWVMGGIE